MLPKIIAIDFDGTLFQDKFPHIGEPIKDKNGLTTIEKVKKMQQEGWYLILWTCRSGNSLINAIRECEKYNLKFNAINSNHPNTKEEFNISHPETESRKIYANYYLDDRALHIDHF